MQDEDESVVDCFAYMGWKCSALNNVHLPRDCKTCRFRKTKAEFESQNQKPNNRKVGSYGR